MRKLRMILLAMCLVPLGQAFAQETKAPDDDGPNEPSEKFGSPVKGPKCGELQGIGIGMVDECLGKPVPQRKSCVDNNKRKFMGLLMNKYGRKCAFVGNIVGRYAKQKGLEVREESGPRTVKKGPNRGVCRRWKATARRVLNNCKSKRGPKRRYCAIRAVRMYSAAVERNRFIRKVCPNLGNHIKGLAMKALGPKLTNSMEKRYNKRRSNNKRFCRPLYSKFRKGINKCTRVRNKFRCLTNIKKRFDRQVRKPRLRVCRHVGNSLAQYAYSKRSLRRAMSRMRGEKIRHYSTKRRVAKRANKRVCRNIEIKARKALLFCSKKPPRNKMACVTKAKRKFDQQVRRARGCRGLDRKLGNYARSLKLPDPGKRRPSSVKRRNIRKRGIAKACRNLERSTKRAINRCARVKNVRRKVTCARKTKAKFDRQLRQRKFRKCRGLNRKIERHATRKGFGKRNMMRMSKVVKGRPGGPRKPSSLQRRRQLKKCKTFMRWFNGVHRFCVRKGAPAKVRRCAMRSQRKVQLRKRRDKFNPTTCPRRHGIFQRKNSMMKRGRK